MCGTCTALPALPIFDDTNANCYADRYQDLKNAFGYNHEHLIDHYHVHGKHEGRTFNCDGAGIGGVKLSNVYGLRFNGASFDENQNGVVSYQAQNICLLAKYGNKGMITNYAKPESYGVTGGGVSPQVHWFGHCRTDYQPYAKCCSNANLLESGQDWNDFSKGNSCQGDGDKNHILQEVHCWFFKSKGIKAGFRAPRSQVTAVAFSKTPTCVPLATASRAPIIAFIDLA